MAFKEVVCIQGKNEQRFRIDKFSDQPLADKEFA